MNRAWAYFGAALVVSTFFSWDIGYSLLGVENSRGLGLFGWFACFLLFRYGGRLAPEALDPFVLYGGGAVAALAVARGLAGVARASIIGGSPVLLGEALVVAFPVAWRLNRWLPALFLGAAVAARCRSAVLAMAAMAFYLWRRR